MTGSRTVWCGSTEPKHRVTQCRTCNRLRKAANRLRKAPPADPVTPRPPWKRDEMNIAVDALYAACKAAGGCVYSGEYIRRYDTFLAVCGRCGVPKSPTTVWNHIEPLYWGGPHTADNLVPACLRCNRSKGPRRLAVSP